MANNHNPNSRLSSVNRKAADELQYKAHAEDGLHILTGTDPAPEGSYYAFLVIEDAQLSVITYLTADHRVTGDITAVTFPAGWYQPIRQGFSTLTLVSGSVELLKYVDKK